jgi:cell division septation protein DedD
VGSQVTLFRFPRGGGRVQAYHPDSLTLTHWSSQQPIPAVRRILGADIDERILWALDAQGNLFSVDLESGGVRTVLPGVTAGVLGPDGSLYLADAQHRIVRVVRRQPVRFHDPLPAAPRALFGAVSDQLVALTAGPPSRLITANAEQALHSTPIPPGEAAATAWGDLVAVATDSALLLYETGGQRSQRSLSSVRNTRRVAFSPSGHRFYLIQDRPEIRVFDRFSLEELPALRLPGPPREFRVDASGRWLLARPLTGDSVWIVDLATKALAATVAGGWSTDLPLVAGAATLLVREDDLLVTFDLRRTPPQRIARLPSVAADFWLVAAWVPRERVPAAVAAAESATVAQDSALRADSVRVAVDSTVIYLQVSRTQNAEWADALAKQLKTDGFPVSILPPKEPEDGYRVLVGPYLTREAAESTGKQLGRAYFLLHLPARHP